MLHKCGESGRCTPPIHPDGSEESAAIANSQITGGILVRLLLPEAYQYRQNLQVVYIDDAGNITPYATKLVIIGGVKYLEFTTNHFSMYAIIGDEPPLLPDAGEAGQGRALPYALMVSAAAMLALHEADRRRRAAQAEMYM